MNQSGIAGNEQNLRREAGAQFFEQAPVAIFVFDDNLRYVDANPAACELLRRSRSEIVGQHLGDFSTLDGPRLANRVHEAHGEVVEESLKITFDNGAARFMEVVTRPNALPGLHLSFGRDVTERHRLQRELEHHNRMETIGKVAGGVIHDFNNMLTAILSYVDLQLACLAADEKGRRYAMGIRAAAERAAETTQQLLAFCRRPDLQMAALDVNDVIREAVPLLRRLIGEHITITLDLDSGLPQAIADAGQLNQVLINLVVNARDAMSGGGRILIGTSRRAAENGELVSIFVHDTGSGISSEVLPHIFDPFFTTKERGKGTGLGLSTVCGIVKQCRGQIFVNTEPGRGTTFEVVLPAAPSRDARPMVAEGLNRDTGISHSS